MKSKDLEAALKALASGFGKAGASSAENALNEFATVFAGTPTVSVAKVVERLRSLPQSLNTGYPNLGTIRELVQPMGALLAVGGTTSAKSDLEIISTFLGERAPYRLQEFVQVACASSDKKTPIRSTSASRSKAPGPALREELVNRYQREFETVMLDRDQFAMLFDRLSNDSEMGARELSALAKGMTGKGAKGREAALKKIFGKHQLRLNQKRRLEAAKGRSAA